MHKHYNEQVNVPISIPKINKKKLSLKLSPMHKHNFYLFHGLQELINIKGFLT